MNNKQLILIILAILLGACIVGGCLYAAINNEPKDLNATNTTTNNNNTTNESAKDTTLNNQEKASDSSNSNDKYTYSPQNDAYVKNSGEDYDTGQVDKNGENIYAHRWVEDGVIYETYQSASGRPIDTNEYYD